MEKSLLFGPFPIREPNLLSIHTVSNPARTTTLKIPFCETISYPHSTLTSIGYQTDTQLRELGYPADTRLKNGFGYRVPNG